MKLIRSAIGLALFAVASAGMAVPVSFPGTNTGAIPDGDPVTGRTVSFAVSGVTSPVASVVLSVSLTHTWAGDLTATLISPGGAARLVVFGRPGVTRGSTFGDSSDLGGTYVFSDLGRPDLVPALQAIDGPPPCRQGPFARFRAEPFVRLPAVVRPPCAACSRGFRHPRPTAPGVW